MKQRWQTTLNLVPLSDTTVASKNGSAINYRVFEGKKNKSKIYVISILNQR